MAVLTSKATGRPTRECSDSVVVLSIIGPMSFLSICNFCSNVSIPVRTHSRRIVLSGVIRPCPGRPCREYLTRDRPVVQVTCFGTVTLHLEPLLTTFRRNGESRRDGLLANIHV